MYPYYHHRFQYSLFYGMHYALLVNKQPVNRRHKFDFVNAVSLWISLVNWHKTS